MPIQVALFTIGEKYVSGGAKDEAGDNLNASCLKMGWEVVARQALGDDEQALASHLIQTADSGTVDIIFTVDGIGISPKDRVPEAMYQVCEKWIPGLPELIRNRAYEKTPLVALTRGVAGIRGKTLLLNMPGSPTAVKDAMEVLRPVLRLAVDQVKGTPA
ncbi:MAG TPA: molybdenum cofactor synthesis domain-containing protein [bacterium]|nr:molybdenum cofactor synthesis domain-containing protein [bacterium]